MDDALFASLAAEVTGLRRQVAALTQAIERMEGRLPPLLVSIPMAAERLGMSVSTLRRKMQDGATPYIRIGSSVRIDLGRIPTPR